MAMGHQDSVCLTLMADSAYVPSREELHVLGRYLTEELRSLVSALKETTRATDSAASMSGVTVF
jgi:hypothetical protein